MAPKTDRGFIHVTDEADGTTTVEVCAEITGGQPRQVYAMYERHPSVKIDQGVHLTRTAKGGYTQHLAEVFMDDAGSVHVAPIRALR